MASLLVGALPLLLPSPECTAAIEPFMCLYLFGSCDANNQLHQVSQAECVRLRDDVCAGPWETISKAREGALPDCSTFGNQEFQCLGIQLSVMSLAHSQFSFQKVIHLLQIQMGRYLQIALKTSHLHPVHRS